jgi:hypothetical protein
MVVSTYEMFKDDSDRYNYYTRELLFRVPTGQARGAAPDFDVGPAGDSLDVLRELGVLSAE